MWQREKRSNSERDGFQAFLERCEEQRKNRKMGEWKEEEEEEEKWKKGENVERKFIGERGENKRVEINKERRQEEGA